MQKERLDIEFLWLENNGKKINIYPSDASEGISINTAGEIQKFTPEETLPKNRETIFLIVGVIDLLSCAHVIVVTNRNLVGKIEGNQIWRITEVKIYPIGTINEKDEKNVQELSDILLKLLNSGDFYYSYNYDLTNSYQRQKLNEDLSIDDRFYWNKFVHKPFENIPKDHKLRKYLGSIIQGFVCIRTDCKIEDGKNFDFALISRRSCKRTGVRYESRGANLDGNTSNFVETEQLIITTTSSSSSSSSSNLFDVSSFLQVRGSIPIVWQQKTNVKYDPPIFINDNEFNSKNAFNKHFDEQLRVYGKETVVSLIKEKGSEKKLGDVFNKLMQQYKNENLKYHTFDLHHHCGTSKFHKLSLLFDKIDSDISDYSFFSFRSLSVSNKQSGIIRTNCKDSLDRTNLVQSKIAIKVFWEQLRNMQILPKDSPPDSQFEVILRHVWADNGDAISIQYAGTPAVRGDVTRTGKGSIKGLINDGLNSVTRYYLNNFQDGKKQDAIDLFLGKTKFHSQKRIDITPSDNNGFLFMFIASILFLFHLSKPTPSSNGSLNFFQFLILFLWLPIIFLIWFISSLFNKKIGTKMVSRPNFTDHIEDFEK